MQPQLTFRRANLTELEFLRDFAERTFRQAFEATNDPVFFKEYCDEAFSLEQIAGEMANTQSEFWFAILDGQKTAYLKINFDQHAVELNSLKTVQIERLYVAPEFQNRKIGEKLLQLAQKRALDEGAEWLWLTVWQENPPAHRFYERHGFVIFGTAPFELGTEVQTDWLMKKQV